MLTDGIITSGTPNLIQEEIQPLMQTWLLKGCLE